MILHTRGQTYGFTGNVLGRVVFDNTDSLTRRNDQILVTDRVEGLDTNGYAGVLTSAIIGPHPLKEVTSHTPVVYGLSRLDIFEPGQVVRMNGDTGLVRILFRPGSRFNYLLVTERCNSRCVMCSQPPRDIDDRGRIKEHLRLIELLDAEVDFLGITGGEPTLLRTDLFRLLCKCRERLPRTHVHVLTNGRMFCYASFAKDLAAVRHPRLTLGIPLYSDTAREHDFVVQAEGAFDQTAIGLYNLARYGVEIEVRVVIHALTYRQLPRLARYLYHNFPFVSHIALMGLELTGYTRPNLQLLWIDPADYQAELEEAVNFLANRNMTVSIYNHQLCVLSRTLWPFARKSISDWKNSYLEECARCSLRDKCGGFFASGTKLHSLRIRPFDRAAAEELASTSTIQWQ